MGDVLALNKIPATVRLLSELISIEGWFSISEVDTMYSLVEMTSQSKEFTSIPTN